MIAIRKPRGIAHKPLEAYFIKPGKRSQEKKKKQNPKLVHGLHGDLPEMPSLQIGS